MLVYLNDTFISSPNLESHHIHVPELLSKLYSSRLYCKLQKCEFFCGEVKFVGHLINPGGFAIAPSKMGAVFFWPVPNNRTKDWGLLGLANFLEAHKEFFRNILIFYSTDFQEYAFHLDSLSYGRL